MTSPSTGESEAMWTRVPTTPKREARTTPAISRTKTATHLIVPISQVWARRAFIYSDGGGKVAVEPTEAGDAKMYPHGKHTVRITIPAHLCADIPFGTNDIDLTPSGRMLVFDARKVGAPKMSVAAE